ncbi:hypothetical protein [Paenibacillus sp. ISL-20]|uniref:hypothetical protein n=1 Tax=Paenibacillus sp. ISL-20 TaxID=2819163 RepID=UPI001BEA11AE|nr:hypothetical protein [Paenibacillus sp. ISL-20]MBT2762401.1 hypothetical protein [Paenibacillus sp. ISL-20]
MAEYKNINITNLLLNPTNPRHNAVEHQSESIYAMVQDQKDKLIYLARHIVDNGLNPTEFILVKIDDGKWVVREGNRRITALKLLNEPLLVPPEYPKIKKEFQKLSKAMDKGFLKAIPCVVLEDESEINEWVRLKHTGQNEGAGAVGWDGQQTSRFKAYVEGKPDIRTVFLDYLLTFSGLSEDLRLKLYNIKKTNFDRLMGDPDVRDFLGLKVEDNSLILVDGINRFLKMVLDDLANDNLSVGRIYYKSDREAYVQELMDRALQQDAESQSVSHDLGTNESEDNSAYTGTYDHSSSTGKDHEENYSSESSAGDKLSEGDVTDSSSTGEGKANTQSNNSEKSTSGSPRKGRSYPIHRNTVAASVHKLVIGQPRILKLFNELKSLNLNDYPNAAAVLFRTFIELSADHYLEQKKLIQGKISVESTLGVKIDAIAKHIQDSGFMTENQLRAIRQMTSSPTQNQSVKTFHAYVHNKSVTPTATDLKAAWDDLWPFIEKMWS